MSENLHLAMIMDGNRRWAVREGLPKLEGHKHGANKLKEVIKWCEELKVRALTVYALSTENLKRSEKEVNALFSLMKTYFETNFNTKKFNDKGVKVQFLGKLELLPEDLQQVMTEISDKTKNNEKYQLNFCIAYGGHQEIIDSVNKAVENGKKVSKEEFEELLYMKDQPDIVIRTGGAIRTSNFLPWQTAYSEWFFPEEFWPEMSKELIQKIIENFDKRKRNFGK